MKPRWVEIMPSYHQYGVPGHCALGSVQTHMGKVECAALIVDDRPNPGPAGQVLKQVNFKAISVDLGKKAVMALCEATGSLKRDQAIKG